MIGVREVLALRSGELERRPSSPDRLAARTRRLARKQLTWLRRRPASCALDLGDGPAEAALPRLLARWRRGQWRFA